MISDAEFLQTTSDAIRQLGYSQAESDKFATLIGDTPEIDGSKIIVRNESGTIIARVPAAILIEPEHIQWMQKIADASTEKFGNLTESRILR